MIIDAHKVKRKTKCTAEILSIKYMSQLAQTKDEAGEGNVDTYLNNINIVEA